MSEENKVVSLFSYITKNKHQKLTDIFLHFANRWKLSRDSVRNIYYQNFDKVYQDKKFCEQNDIAVDCLKKSAFSGFEKGEELTLVSDIQKLAKSGYSVRKACQILANGDTKKMVRYLNKYRSVVRANPSLFEGKNTTSNAEQITQIATKTRQTPKSNIIKMPVKSDLISEQDIQSLFMGLVRLVKNNTIKEMEFTLSDRYKEQLSELRTLKQSLVLIENELQEEKRLSSRLQLELNTLRSEKFKNYEHYMLGLNVQKNQGQSKETN